MALHFVARAACALVRRAAALIAPEAVRWMLDHNWPGNVRELRNAMERAVLLCFGDLIRLPDVCGQAAASRDPVSLLPRTPRSLDSRQLGGVVGGTSADPTRLWRVTRDAELAAITDAMNRSGGNQTRAAKLLQISRGTLVSRLTEYGLPRPRKGRWESPLVDVDAQLFIPATYVSPAPEVLLMSPVAGFVDAVGDGAGAKTFSPER